jgi:sec-independent protein translocase protein TatA
MGSFGPLEIGLIFLVILLVFGAKRIPEIARGMGKGIREFKDATKDIQRELTVEDNAPRIQPPQQHTASRPPSARELAQNPPPAEPAQPHEQTPPASS